MLSPDALLNQLQRLARNTANPPEPEGMVELCADWMELLGSDLDDAGLRAAVTRHLRASRFWPTPSELLADVVAAEQADAHQLEAKGEHLFSLVAKARSSAGPDVKRARHAMAHYGVPPEHIQPCLAAVGPWASFEPGDRVLNARPFEFARRAFGKAFAAAVAPNQLRLPPPAPRLVGGE